MSAGWVLVQTVDGDGSTVAGALARLPGVVSAERTEGAYDVVARVTDLGGGVPSAGRVLRAAMHIPGVTLAVACHDGPAAGGGDTVLNLRDVEAPELEVPGLEAPEQLASVRATSFAR